MDPLDFDNIKYNQKRDRQILFILCAIVWILEMIWDALMSEPAAAKTKKKSIIAAKKDASAAIKKEKNKREKIE